MQVLQTLPSDFILRMLLFGSWGCQLKGRFVRSFLFCPHFRDEGRTCGKFLKAQKLPLSTLELVLLLILLSLPHFCLILSLILYPKYLQACSKHPEIIYTWPRLIWKNGIHKVLAITLNTGSMRKREENQKTIICKSCFLKDKKNK